MNGDTSGEKKKNIINNDEMIALIEQKGLQQGEKKEEKEKTCEDKSKFKMFKTSNLINEFKNRPDLDFEYEKSFVAITRVIFISYVFYLIIYSICWIIYYSIDTPISNVDSPSTSNFIIYLYSAYLVILLIIFIFLLIFEFKQIRYKLLKNDIQKRIAENKVDKAKAENNFKEAISHYKESTDRIKLLEETLDSDHRKSLSKFGEFYSKFSQIFALTIIIYICCVNLLAFKFKPNALTFIGHSVWYIEIILILYCMYPYNVYLKCAFALLFSILYESLSLHDQYTHDSITTSVTDTNVASSTNIVVFVFAKILFNFVLHLIGIYLYMYLEILKRNTFLNLYTMSLTYINAQQSKTITETMIKSIMPPLFTNIFGKPEEFKKSAQEQSSMRPLYVYPIDNISILFADIVGFTKMSSKKTAEELVFLLNDLYGRFDRLCEEHNCEKISTLGDCYYCVSGCLNCREDHAKCCVEMGLSMVKEIEAFNMEHNVEVNMRVGVHTGKALCGFIGGKRFRFDVWSSDVTFANKMESSGRAGWVHISQKTFNQLNNEYNMEKDDAKINGEYTYFVIPDEKRRVKNKTVKDALEHTLKKQELEQQKQKNNGDSIVVVESTAQEVTNTNKNSNKNLIEFFRPDINPITMSFKHSIERKYYEFLMGYKFLQRDPHNQLKNDKFKISTKKWSNPRNIFFISIFFSLCFNICILFSYLSIYLTSYKSIAETISLIVTFSLLVLTQLALVIVYFKKYGSFQQSNKTLTAMFMNKALSLDPNDANTNHRLSTVSQNESKESSLIKYVLLHLVSILYLVLTPIIVFIFSFVLKHEFSSNNDLFLLYSSLTFIFTIIQFSTFIQLNNLFKTILMALYVTLYCAFAITGGVNSNGNTLDNLDKTNQTDTTESVKAVLYNASININIDNYYTTYFQTSVSSNTNYSIIIDMVLLVILVCIINRQFELVQRVCFQSDQDTNSKVNSTKEEKDLANWLIDVVIPAHVVEHVKAKKQYSHNYDCVGVLFVSLCNYAEFYEETFQGGRELIRVLNEISIDFDQVLDEPRYRSIEKIKSIGSTFMIASGLNVDDDDNNRNDPVKRYQHLYDLVDFALTLWEKLEVFNRDAMSVCHFKFQMRMGLNFGPVTAGVIGKDRLLYDIWGDTVNVASRMDSTGQEGLLQTPEAAAKFLSNKYLFHYRDKIKVKGKDEMITYVLKANENRGKTHKVGLIEPNNETK